jgi:hypothetical protein
MIYESKHSILTLPPVIKGQYDHQGEADSGGQGQGQQPKEQREARTLGGLAFWKGLGRFAATAGWRTL